MHFYCVYEYFKINLLDFEDMENRTSVYCTADSIECVGKGNIFGLLAF